MAIDAYARYLAQRANNAAQKGVEDIESLRRYLGINTAGNTIEAAQKIVQSGLAEQYFAVGDQFNTTFTDEKAKVYANPFDIVHFGNVETEDSGGEIPGMFMQMHYAGLRGIPFDEQQALYDCDNALPAGTYHFTVAGNPWLAAENGKTYQFTLAAEAPASSQLCLDGSKYNAALEGTSLLVYANEKTFTATQTATLTEGSAGTKLGTNGDGSVNYYGRATRGYNRWATSAIRQYLNSDSTTKGAWWSKQERFGRAPSNYASCAGFMSGLSDGFRRSLKKVKVSTARDTSDSDGGVDITYDYFFTPSLQQMNIEPQVSDVEGETWEYYKTLAMADETGKMDALGRYKQWGTYPSLIRRRLEAPISTYYWSRSCRRGTNGFTEWIITSDGRIDNTHGFSASNSCAPACVIC